MTNLTIHALFRNSSNHIERTLAQFADPERHYNISYRFFENDSADNTVEQLNGFAANRDCKIFSYNFGAPQFGSVPSTLRTALLSFYRNKLKGLAGPPNTEYTLLLDTDLIFTVQDLNALFYAMNVEEKAVMTTANTQQNVPDFMFGLTDTSYYDVWPLRDRFGSQGAYFSSCPFYNEQDQSDWRQFFPVQTLASFGGFALIESEVYNKCYWSADFHSEHVNFCAEVNNWGRIYAVPNCRPKVEVNLANLNLENCQKNAEQQKKMFDTSAVLHRLSKESEFRFGPYLKS